MRKIHTAWLVGAVVVSLGAVMGLAAFAPSLIANKSATHELTLNLPDGGTETIAYAGNIKPKVTFQTDPFATAWPTSLNYDWALPTFVALDPVFTNIDKQLDMLASTPVLTPLALERPLSAAALKNLRPGTSYSMVSEIIGNGVCTHYTQVTKSAGVAQPKIVSHTSGKCGTATNGTVSQPSENPKAADLRAQAL